MSNQSYASLGNYNGTQSGPRIAAHTPSMKEQYIHVNSQNFGYDALSHGYKGRQYNAITDSYGAGCGQSITSSCGANEYYNSNNNSNAVKYKPVKVRGSWDQVKGLYELNPQADNCIVNKKPEYYKAEHKLEIYGMEGCPHCVKVKKSLDEIKRLLKDIKVEVDYISSREQPDKFKEGATQHSFKGFPAFCLDKGTKTWLGASPPDSIKQKVQDYLNGSGKRKVASNRQQKSSGDNKNMVIVSADSWCSYSMAIRKELEQIKKALAELGVGITYVSDKDNKSDFDKYSNKYNIRGYPTIIFDAGGELEDVWPGYAPADKLKDRAKKHMEKRKHKKERKESDDDVMLVCISADDWCGYSRKLSASKNELSQKLGANGIKLNMVNATENKPEFDRLSKEHNVRGFPHCVLIVNGKKVVDISGYRPPEGMLQECMKNL